MRILLVEDCTPVRESVAQALEEAGFAVDSSADGEEGLWPARIGDYDLDNAITYVNDEGDVRISLSAENGGLALAVSNTGGRLRSGGVHRVFERFWRADSFCHRGGDVHCGLGLPLCKGVIEQLGGSIDATADAVGVFTLTIHLPCGGSDGDDRRPAAYSPPP